MPQLKSFLKTDAEILEYKNVEVKFVPGRKAVLTIYDDGTEKEKITLSDYKSKAEMHKLMLDKGFVKKSAEDISKMQQETKEREMKEKKDRDEARAKMDEKYGYKRPPFRGSKEQAKKKAAAAAAAKLGSDAAATTGSGGVRSSGAREMAQLMMEGDISKADSILSKVNLSNQLLMSLAGVGSILVIIFRRRICGAKKTSHVK